MNIHRKTLCDWTLLASDWLSIIYRAIQYEHWRCPYRQIDEPPIRYLEPGSGKARQGYLRSSNIPGGSVFFHWHDGRDAKGLDALFDKQDPQLTDEAVEEIQRIIQCDGHSAYGPPALALARCAFFTGRFKGASQHGAQRGRFPEARCQDSAAGRLARGPGPRCAGSPGDRNTAATGGGVRSAPGGRGRRGGTVLHSFVRLIPFTSSQPRPLAVSRIRFGSSNTQYKSYTTSPLSKVMCSSSETTKLSNSISHG